MGQLQTNAQANVSANVSASASHAKDKRCWQWKRLRMGMGMESGMREMPMHKHDENVLQFAVKFARSVYFQIMRKLFAYAPH